MLQFISPSSRVADTNTVKVALKIHALLHESKISLTEAEIRHVIGDNPVTEAALRCVRLVLTAIFFRSLTSRLLVSTGHAQKLGLTSRKYMKQGVDGPLSRTLATGRTLIWFGRASTSTHAFMAIFRWPVSILTKWRQPNWIRDHCIGVIIEGRATGASACCVWAQPLTSRTS